MPQPNPIDIGAAANKKYVDSGGAIRITLLTKKKWQPLARPNSS